MSRFGLNLLQDFGLSPARLDLVASVTIPGVLLEMVADATDRLEGALLSKSLAKFSEFATAARVYQGASFLSQRVDEHVRAMNR
jgi:hypothetical protein